MLSLRSHGTFLRQPLLRMPVLALVYLALWIGAELVAFAAVTHAIGFVGAIFACFLTGLAGLAMLRRMGLSAAMRLRQTVGKKAGERNGLSKEALLDGTLAALGAILLILPGFVSDLVGLALAAPSVRVWVRSKLKLGVLRHEGNGRRPAPALIDLTPREWSRDEGQEPLP
jgi:UPF0716 protein FxsA